MQKKDGHSFVLAQSCCLVENVFIVDDAVFLSVRILSIWCRFQGLWKIQQELCTDTSIASEVWWIYWSLFVGGRRTGCPVCCYLGTGFSFPSSAQEEFSYFSSSSCLQYNHLLQSGTIFLFFFYLAQSLAQQSVSHVDDIKTSDFFHRLNPNCVFLCVRLTHMKVHGFMTDLCDGWNTVYLTNVFGYVISDALWMNTKACLYL